MDDRPEKREPLTVSRAEAGQKLLRFLARRFGVPETAAHRWVRTGQVRVNGGRCKPFTRLAEGDLVRVPPAAWRGSGSGEPEGATRAGALPEYPGNGLETLQTEVPVVFADDDLLVLNKPAGLPSQPGSGHSASVSALLERCFAGADFVPAPAHRLDAATSGLLLVGRSYACLRMLTEAFHSHESLKKEYLAWACGVWPGAAGSAMPLEDRLSRGKGASGRVEPDPQGVDALAEAFLVRRLELLQGVFSLVRVRLFTGRMHQIRAQLSIRGCSILGDVKYGGMPADRLYLHAARVDLPDSRTFCVLPDWPAPFGVDDDDLA